MSHPSNPRRAVAAALLALVVLLASGSSAGAATAGRAGTQPAGRLRSVTVVTFPRLTWERLGRVDTPHLDAFLSHSALASMSVRTVGTHTEPGAAYLTIGSGGRATSTLSDGQAANRSEPTGSGNGAEVYQRRTGRAARGDVVALGWPEQVAYNKEFLYGTEPGRVAGALAGAGIHTGAVGNAGTGVSAVNLAATTSTSSGDIAVPDLPQRQIALAAAGPTGQVTAGDVGADLLTADPAAPFGVRADHGATLGAVARARQRARVVFVEMSDLERAEQARGESSPAQGDRQYDAALAAADAMFGEITRGLDPHRDLVLMVGPTAPLDVEQLTVFAARGPGFTSGWAVSSTTRRAGYVTLTDIGATVLRACGVAVPSAVSDTPITASASDVPAATRASDMVTTNERAMFRDEAFGPITVVFILLLVVMLALVAYSVTRRPSWSPWLTVTALVVMALPPVTYLGGLFPYGGFVVVTYALALLAMAVVVAALARALARREVIVAPLAIAALTVVVAMGDVVVGAPLQINTIFGYSPIVAGRFSGYGNQVYSLLAVSTLMVATAGWEVWGRRWPGTARWRVWALLGLFAVVVMADGAPSLGADVGGVLAATPAFAVCTMMLLGKKIRARTVVWIGLGTVALLTAFAAVDLARPAESRSHLGRFAAKLIDGGAAVIVRRKVEANLGVLTSTAWTWVIPVALLFFAYLTWRPNRLLHRINAVHPTFRPFGASALVLGLAAWALNDSGVSMPAMMLAVALPYTAVLALEVTAASEPAAEPPPGGPNDEPPLEKAPLDGDPPESEDEIAVPAR